MLHEAIQHIKRPLEFSARNSFTNIGRIRDLERTISVWVEQLSSSTLSPEQQQLLHQFRELFFRYDQQSVQGKIKIVQAAFSCLDKLENLSTKHLITPVPPPETADSHGSEDLDASQQKPLDLTAPIQFAKGVGPKRARLLNRLGISTIEHAVFFFPRRYEDRRRIAKIAALRPGDRPTTVYGIVKKRGLTITPRQKTKIFELMLGDDTGIFIAKWFNQGYLRKVFTPGMSVVLSGKISLSRYGDIEMIQPEYEILGKAEMDEELLHTGRIVPIYPLTDGLYQKEMRKVMKNIVDHYVTSVEESLPDVLQKNYGFLGLSEALRQIHFPDNSEDLALLNSEKSRAHQRLIFDEFFLLELGMGLKRHHTQTHDQGITFQFQGRLEQQLRKSLEFSLTTAQNRVIQEIQQDMQAPRVMNRLLQGDVGSGKTIVALASVLSALEAGYQAAIMVPTEILAEQHFRKISHYLDRLNVILHSSPPRAEHTVPKTEPQPDLYGAMTSQQISTCLLTGSLRKKYRKEVLQQIERGEIKLIVGTHALLQHDVTFHNLGIIVIDEQHKFGVMQRATLKAKGYNPDVLIMTATPIPRTLSLTVYGDLDISVLDELPPGRSPVITKRFYEQSREKAYRLIEREIQQGRQIYIVYPLVEESENLDLKAATEMSQHLAADVFPQYQVGLVHGRMKAEEKDRQMMAFKDHHLDILVSTTVLEVGIDVPNATVMLIEHAERFGLSQLHQLRGRVGRGSQRSYCLLMTAYPISNEARRRLDAMVETTDGFIIAERDLEIRGPGEFFGTKQSGLPDLKIANLLRDTVLLARAREEAFRVISNDPDLTFPQHRALKRALEQRWEKSLDLISIG